MFTLSHDPIHSRIFEAFVRHCSNNVATMKSSDHALNVGDINPYHMEGDVWTHTCLCYNALLQIEDYYRLSPDQQFLTCVATLCHDLGKPYVRHVNEIGRPRFIGHEKRSVIETINIVDFLTNVLLLTPNQVYIILAIVAAHSEYWTADTMQAIVPLLNYNSYVLNIYKVVVTADQLGQIKMDGFASKKNIFDFPFNLNYVPNLSNDKLNAFILIGPPASGKDTVISSLSNNVEIISFDDMRLEFYKKEHIIPADMSPAELYSEAWKWCNKKHINFMPGMKIKIVNAILHGKDIAIANTNMTVKTRAMVTNLIREVSDTINIVAVLNVVSEQVAIHRDKNRGDCDKVVGADVIRRMNNAFELPTFNEDFDNIFTIINQ